MHIRSTEEAQREHSGKQEGVRWELGYRVWGMGLWDYGIMGLWGIGYGGWVDVCDCQDGSGDFEADVVAGE